MEGKDREDELKVEFIMKRTYAVLVDTCKGVRGMWKAGSEGEFEGTVIKWKARENLKAAAQSLVFTVF